MSKRASLILALSILSASALSFFMLTRGHPWWDDFASYVMQARAILDGSMPEFIRRNAFTIENSLLPPGPVAYPWGFPLLLVPVYALFGINPLALKLVGVVFYALFLVALFLLVRTRLDEKEALLLSGLFALNPSLLLATDLILSDIPFLFFSTLGIFLVEKYPRHQKPGTAIALGLTIFLAFFIRTNGILLLVPLGVSLVLVSWPNWKTALRLAVLPLAAFAIPLFFSFIIFPNGQDSYLSHFSLFSLPRLVENVFYYMWLPWRMFENLPGGVVVYPILAFFALVSLLAHWKRDAAFYSYCLATAATFILWPERQGLRFFYPLLPFLLIYTFDGMKLTLARLPETRRRLAGWFFAGFWGLLLLLSAGTSIHLAYTNMAAGRAINGPFDIYSYQMYEFVREQTPADSVILFMRPRALRLFTDRDSFTSTDCADLSRGDYVILHEKMGGTGQVPPEEVTTCNPSVTLEEVFNNKRLIIYKLNK